MEYNQPKSVGAGIITISVLHFIAAAFTILGDLVWLFRKDLIMQYLQQAKQTIPESVTEPSQYIVGIILTLILVISVILILLKKSIGIYIYFTRLILSIIYSIIMNGFSILSIIFSLILPILMLIFILLKKDVFGFSSQNQESDM